MGPLAEIKRPSSFHPTALFLDGHRRPRLYRTCILSQSISLFKYPSELSAKPHWGEASGHLDPRIVQTNRIPERHNIREGGISMRAQNGISRRRILAMSATAGSLVIGG